MNYSTMKSRGVHELIKRGLSFIQLRVKEGPLKGTKMIATTGSHFIAGDYEPEKTACIAEAATEGMTIVDVGAHVGYFTMIMAKKVGSGGAIHSFEPRDLNRNFLKRHIRSNGISNVTVYSQCVGDQYGKVMFEERTGTGTGHISTDGNVEVDMVTLDGMVAEGKIPVPDMLKIDVEGAEILVLNGARETISSRKPKMVLAVHSDELERECREILEPLGYTFTDLGQAKGDKEFLVECA